VNTPVNTKNTRWFSGGGGAEGKNHPVLLFLFFFCLFFDLGGALYVRHFALLILMGVVLHTLLASPKMFFAPFLNLSILALFLAWPMMSAYIGFYKAANGGLIVQNILALVSFPILIIFFSNFTVEDIVNGFTRAATLLGFVVLALWVLLYFDNSLAHVVADEFSEREAGYFGIREMSGLSFPVIYFKATLFFVPAIVLLLQNDKFLCVIVLLSALMAATSKTGVVVAALAILISIFKRKSSFMLVSGVLIFLGVFLVLVAVYFDAVIYALFTDENTLMTRVGHWGSLSSMFLDNPSYFFMGQGAGTEFYSMGAGEFVNNIELDHLNSIRKFGLIWFAGFVLFVYGVIRENQKIHKTGLAAALMVAFVICGTNPVLLTLMFFSILAFSYVAAKRESISSLDALTLEI
jgi:hypothetical protein